MSILSPIARGIAGMLQASLKNDAGTDENAQDFLAMLGGEATGDASASTSPAAVADQPLMDSLYRKGDGPELGAISSPLAATPRRLENASSTSDAAEKTPVRELNASSSPAASRRDDAPAPRAQQSGANDNTAASSQRAAPAAPAGKNLSEKAKSASDATDGQELPEDEALIEKLRAKIDDLSDILSAIAGLMGVGQVTVVTKTSLQIEAQPQSLDMSKRLEALMAAITAGQILPQDASKSLNDTLASFQQLLASMTKDAAGASPADIGANIANSQTALGNALQTMQASLAPSNDNTALMEQMKKMAQWLDQLSAQTAQDATAKLPANFVPQAAVMAAASSAPIASSANIAKDKNAADLLAASDVSSRSTTDVNPAPQTVSVPLSSTSPTTNAASTSANMVQNLAPAAGNASGNNAGNNGQGGERAPVMMAANAVNANAVSGGAATSAISFSNALKAAANVASVPVPEQVAFNIKTAVKSGASDIQIHLDPAELGKLHIKIALGGDGKASGIVITADHQSTLDLLQRDARGLQNALADAGIKTDAGSLSFNLRGGNQGQGRDDAPKAAYAGYQAIEEEDVLAPLAVVSRHYVVNMQNGLDIQI